MIGVGLGVNAIQVAQPVASGDFMVASEIDAVTGTYTFNGAPVALADIVDCTTDLFNPSQDIDAGGIKVYDDPVNGLSGRIMAFTGDLLASVVGGFTIVVEVYTGDDFILTAEAAGDAGGSDPYSSNKVMYDSVAPSSNYDLFAIDDTDDFGDLAPITANSIIKIAMTNATDRLALSVAGGAAIVSAHSAIDVGSAYADFNWGTFGNPTARIRKFTIYDVQDDADLPALSS